MTNTSPIVPVLDLMIGQIVLASGGTRAEYRPVHSKLTHSSAPVDVAKAMFYQTGCDCLYLADIDSFAGAELNWNVYNDLLSSGFGLWVDANWLSKNRTGLIGEKLKSTDRLRVILSSETMTTSEDFDQVGRIVESGITPIFSLDKKGDAIITQPGELSDARPLELVQKAYEKGVRDLIVLDLDAVGTMQGVGESGGEESGGGESCCEDSGEADGEKQNELRESVLGDFNLSEGQPSEKSGKSGSAVDLQPLLHEICEELPDLKLISGGGVRSATDAQRLLDAGCQHVLVASAIHECKFTPDDVAALNPFNGKVNA